MSDATPGELSDPLWERRWLLAGQAVLIVATLAVFVVVVEPTWDWRLFSWGVVVGLGAAVLIVGIGRRATSGDGVSVERKVRTRRHLVIYAAAWLLAGVLAGFGSALVESVWPDVMLLAFLVLTLVIAAALMVKVWRRSA
jgi:MFS family permease